MAEEVEGNEEHRKGGEEVEGKEGKGVKKGGKGKE